MYLIDSNTFQLKWFPADRPPYAILSHTWGLEEVSFGDLDDFPKAKQKAGFNKIRLTCEQSLRDGVQYAWVDTCCINKDSSAELSEAINSMYKWYEDAAFCYAYLEDISEEKISTPEVTDASVLEGCKWFTRGWTLQELLAPKNVIFFGSAWNQIGAKEDLSLVLAKVTGIPADVLTKAKRLDEVSVADRMSWAAGRKTTRAEDIAYSLMGIFDVNMPMLYGEGTKAFIRLQEEILRQTQDDSLFAWRASEESASEYPFRGLFASSPKEFASAGVGINSFNTAVAGSTSVSGNGHISLSCILYGDREQDRDGRTTRTMVLGLKCYRGTDLSKVVGIEVVGIAGNAFLRCNPSELIMRAHKNRPTFENITIERYTAKREAAVLDDIYRRDAVFIKDVPGGVKIKNVSPAEFSSFTATRIFPLVNLIGKKVTVEFDIDKYVSGVSVLEEIGWSTTGTYTPLPPPSSSAEAGAVETGTKAPDRLSIWVEARPAEVAAELHRYCFNIHSGADTKSVNAVKPIEPATVAREGANRQHDEQQQHDHHDQAVRIGWSTLKVTGMRQKVGGYAMFCISLDLSVNAEQKAAAEAKLKEERRGEITFSCDYGKCGAYVFALSPVIGVLIFLIVIAARH